MPLYRFISEHQLATVLYSNIYLTLGVGDDGGWGGGGGVDTRGAGCSLDVYKFCFNHFNPQLFNIGRIFAGYINE